MTAEPGRAITTAMVTLTLTTGLVEAVSFLVLGPVFTAVQTGNLLFLGFAIAGEEGLSVAAPSFSLCGFMAGVLLGARFESALDSRGHRWLVTALVVESLVLGVAGLMAWGITQGEPLSVRHHAVTATVAVAMGMRNVTTLRAGVPDLPTTVATRVMVGFFGGSPLALDTRIGSGMPSEVRRAAAVAATLGGGLLGAWLLHEAVRPSVVLLTAAAAVLTVGLVYARVTRLRPEEPV